MSKTNRILSFAGVLGAALCCFSFTARAEDKVVKVGILHSLSGTMAISETSLRDVLLFAFDEINAQGGVDRASYKIEPVIVDGASNWPLFAEKAKQLLEEDKVAVTFGCWTSVSRKSVLPVFEKDNGLLFYPVQYEGEELSKNIFYTAEAVNQQATPAVDYLLAQGKKKFYLIGTDYVYPQTTNLILYKYLLLHGIPIENIGGGLRKDDSGKVISAGKYTPFGHTDYQQIVADIKQFAASGDACVINTINGDSNVPFFKEIAAAGLTPADCPVVSFSLAEDELRALPTKDLVGELGCWTYFMSLNTPGEQDLPGQLEHLAQDRELSGRGQGKARGGQPDGALLRRRLSLEGGGGEGRHLRRGQGARGARVRRHQLRRPRRQDHDAEEPPRHQERLHRRNQGQWPVQDPRRPSRRCRASPSC